ncbi:hypothetical protein [Dethiosulfatarculus sandiegensis]|nr:hypothetical protein [Dethiosulfatarculus sandiegensis]
MPQKRQSMWPRFLATILLSFILLVLSTTLLSWWSLGPLRLQPLLVIVVSAGFKLPLIWGGCLVFMLGYASDLLSGGVMGLQTVAYMMAFAGCAIAERKLEINSCFLEMLAVGLNSLVYQAVVTGGLILMDSQSAPLLDSPGMVLAQVCLSALTAPVFFAVLEGLVRLFTRFFPKQRSLEV